MDQQDIEAKPFSKLALAHLDEVGARHQREVLELLRVIAEDAGLELGGKPGEWQPDLAKRRFVRITLLPGA
jgi:hypothetical protein